MGGKFGNFAKGTIMSGNFTFSTFLKFSWFIGVLSIQTRGFSQGTVVFSNRSAGSTTHVFGWPTRGTIYGLSGNAFFDNPSGSVDYSGCVLIGANGLFGQFGASTTFAQLLAANGAGQPESSLIPALGVTTFRTGVAAGNLAPITATLRGVPLDSPAATLQMVVWDNSSGLFPTWTEASVAWLSGFMAAGRSQTFTVNNIGGNLNSAPNLDGLQSFSFWTTGLIPEPSAIRLGVLGTLLFYLRRSRPGR
jgi:hypothetical protein